MGSSGLLSRVLSLEKAWESWDCSRKRHCERDRSWQRFCSPPGAGLVALEKLLLSPAPRSPQTPRWGEAPQRAEWERSGMAARWVILKIKMGASHN